MTQSDIQNLKAKLRLYVLRHEDMNYSSIATKFIEENETVLSHRSIRNYISQIKKAEEDLDDDISDLNEQNDSKTVQTMASSSNNIIPTKDDAEDIQEEEIDVEEKSEANDVTDSFIFKFKHANVDYEFDRNLIDKIHCAYSRKGFNLTSGVIQSMFGISSTELRAIMSKFELTKESEPYSDYSFNALHPTFLYEELEENTKFILDNLHENDTTVTGKLNKLYKKSLITSQQEDLKFSSIVEELKDLLPTFEIKPDLFDSDINLSKHIHLIIPDMHIGLDQNNYNVKIVSNQLNTIGTMLMDEKSNIHVHFLGDIIHSVSGLNHKDDWKSMDKTITGANAIITPYKILLGFLLGFGKSLHSVNFVGGE